MTRKPIIYTADAARIDEHQDGRIAIIVDTDEGDKLYVDIHDCALAFYASVQANLRPYALEAEDSHAKMPVAPDHRYLDGPDYDLARDLARGK